MASLVESRAHIEMTCALCSKNAAHFDRVFPFKKESNRKKSLKLHMTVPGFNDGTRNISTRSVLQPWLAMQDTHVHRRWCECSYEEISHVLKGGAQCGPCDWEGVSVPSEQLQSRPLKAPPSLMHRKQSCVKERRHTTSRKHFWTPRSPQSMLCCSFPVFPSSHPERPKPPFSEWIFKNIHYKSYIFGLHCQSWLGCSSLEVFVHVNKSQCHVSQKWAEQILPLVTSCGEK